MNKEKKTQVELVKEILAELKAIRRTQPEKHRQYLRELSNVLTVLH